jgi:hypothetical protein
VSQPIDIVQRSLPEPELLVLDAVEQIERDIVFRVRSRGRPRCPSCSGAEVSYHSTYVRRLRDLPWQGQPVQGAGPGEDSSPSLSQSALSTQDLCGAIARRRRPAGTRNESTKESLKLGSIIKTFACAKVPKNPAQAELGPGTPKNV